MGDSGGERHRVAGGGKSIALGNGADYHGHASPECFEEMRE